MYRKNHRHGGQNGSRNYNYQERNYDDRSEVVAPKHSKGMILLKASVYMMFIVLVTLIVAFVLVKNRQTTVPSSEPLVAAKCNKVKNIKIAREVSEIKALDGEIWILSKAENNKQELIKIDSVCGEEVARVVFEIAK